MTWTKNQKAAIDINNKTILVAAAAGSGKTAVLVQRIVNKILNKDLDYSINDLLVMTFTKSAASSMKERIKKSLEKALENIDKRNKKEYKRIKKEIDLVDMARISTIDSFFMNIVKENIDKVDLDPSFSISNEENLKLLKSDVMQELLEEEYEKAEEDFLFLLDIFAKTRGDDGLAANIEKIYSYSRTRLDSDKILEDLENDKFDIIKLETYLFTDTQLIIKRATENIEKIEELAGIDEFLFESLYGKKSKKDSEGIYNKENNERDSIYLCQNAKSIYDIQKVLDKINFHTFRISKKADEEIVAKAKSLREEYKNSTKELKEKLNFTKERLELEYEFSLKLSKALIRLVRLYSTKLLEKKLERKILDFNDVALYALSILWKNNEKTEVALSYAKEFKEIYIDEYQDSNYIQERLIEAIETNNIFMVGDVKQSIYRFRDAKPELFVDKYDKYKDYEEGEEARHIKVVLSDNFRSRKEVLYSINSIFYKIMSKELGDIAYDKLAALNPAARYTFEDVAEKTKFYYINKVDKDIKEEYGGTTGIEAKIIAKTIENLISSKKQIEDEITEELDSKAVKKKILRNIEYRDIVILLRDTKDKANIIVEELTNRGIPCYANSKTGFFDTYEIQKILAILSVIDNPSLEVSLCAYLKSPIVDLDDKAISLLSSYDILNERDLYKSILYLIYIFDNNLSTKEKNEYIQIFKIEDIDLESEKTRLINLLGEEAIEKVIKAFSYIRIYRKESAYLPLHIFIRKLITETDFINYISALPYGDIRKANLLLLVEKAKAYEESGYTGLYNFVRYISDLKEQATDFGEASLINEYANTVRIMTIHASKGLEYPVCILAGLQNSFKNTDIKDKMLLDNNFGLGFTYIDTKYHTSNESIKKELIKDKIREEIKAEELRLLYVAMTRAKDMLIMTAYADVDAKRNKIKGLFLDNETERALPKYYINSASSYLDWILLSEVSNSKYIEYKELSIDELETENIEKEDTSSELVNDFINLDTSNIKACIDFKYRDIENTKLKNKFSVTELKRNNQLENDVELKYEAMEKPRKKAKYSLTNRGNAYHKFMDLLDFSLLAKGYKLEDIREKIEKEKLMSKEDLSLISLKDIENFISSDIGKKIKKAALENRLYREKEFYMGLSAKELGIADSDELILVQGVVDAYIEESDGIIILDYKTDRIQNIEELKSRYEKQLDYYARAISASTNKTILAKIIWSFELSKELIYL